MEKPYKVEVIEGVSCEFFIDPRKDDFVCTLRVEGEEEEFRAETFPKCREKVTKALRRSKKKIAVGAYHLHITGRYHGTQELHVDKMLITGRNTGNNRVLTVKNGERGSMRESNYDDERILRHMTDEEVQHLRGLYQAKESSARAWVARLDELKLNVNDALKEAYGADAAAEE